MTNRRIQPRRRYIKRRTIKFEISIKNFGPISSAKVRIKPLTIFIGPNNSGKSYAAMLIHSIIESHLHLSRWLAYPPFYVRDMYLIELEANTKQLRKEISNLENQIWTLKPNEELKVSKDLIDTIYCRIFEEIYERNLRDEIVRSFACPLRELVKIRKRSFSIDIVFNSYVTQVEYKRKRLMIKKYPDFHIPIIIKATEKIRGLKMRKERKRIVIEIGIPEARKKRGKEFYTSEVIGLIFEICVSQILETIAMPCYYLPAARSGILQGHKALAASIVRKAPSVGIERIEIPKFSGVVADFISSVITMPEEKSSFYRLAQDFERELINGEIVVRTLDEYLYPEIKYSFENTEIPLHRSSSTVSELAPLFLYLKYNVEPGNILIIEEPEAHLHPENQRILAKLLVRLIRKGVIILITTHSEYLLEQLNSFILLSQVEANKRVKEYKYNKEDFLKPQEVAAYVFNYDKKSGGHKTSKVKITGEEGISEQEFLRIHEALYEETIRLRRDLSVKT